MKTRKSLHKANLSTSLVNKDLYSSNIQHINIQTDDFKSLSGGISGSIHRSSVRSDLKIPAIYPFESNKNFDKTETRNKPSDEANFTSFSSYYSPNK